MAVGTPNTARVALIYSYPTDTNTFENVFYVRDVSGALFSDIALYAGEIATAAVAHVMTFLCPDINLRATLVEDVRTVPFGGYEYTLSPPAVGTAAYSCNMPSSNAFAVKKLTGNVGRSGRGRWYWPLFGSLQLSAPDTVAVTTANAILTHLGDFQTAVEALISGSEMGIVSYRFNGAPRAAGLFQQIVSWAYTDLSVDTQRRRLVAHNRHR